MRTSVVAALGLAAITTAGVSPIWLRAATATPAPAVVNELLSRDLGGAEGKELQLLTVQYVPGGASLPHRHHAQVFVYVLQGSLRMQVQGSPLVTLGPGDTFYEGPDDIHVVSANASTTAPARFLVFAVKNKGAPLSTAARREAVP